MSAPLWRRKRADTDVAEAVAWYVAEGDADLALDLIDELEAAYSAISENPALGSPLWGYELGIPGLRAFALERFPYMVFTVESDAGVEVWRVLHTKRDIGAIFAEG